MAIDKNDLTYIPPENDSEGDNKKKEMHLKV